jgi:predicted component of type VI protein secretion system
MPFQLVPLNPGTSPFISLQRPVILIGRHLDGEARIEHAKVSRRHCCIAIAYDRIILRDLGSRHGVRVNGRKVEEVRLEVGDEVAIGPLIFRFDGDAAGKGPAAGSASRPAPAAPGKPAAAAPPGVSPANWVLDDPDLDLIPLDDL